MWRRKNHGFFPECTYSSSVTCVRKLSLIRTERLKSLSLGKKGESELEVYTFWAVPKGRAFQSVIMRHPCGTPARRAGNNICIITMLQIWQQTQRRISVLRISKQAKIVLHGYTILEMEITTTITMMMDCKNRLNLYANNSFFISHNLRVKCDLTISFITSSTICSPFFPCFSLSYHPKI